MCNSNIGGSTNDHLAGTLVIFFQSLGTIFLYTGHVHGRQKLSIRKLNQSVSVATDTCKPFYIVIPGLYLFVAEWPVNSNAVFGIGLKVKVTPTITLSSPHQGAPSYMVSAEPVVSFYLCVWAFLIFHPIIEIGLIKRVVAFKHRIIFDHLLCSGPAVWEVPCFFVCVHIVFDVFNVSASLQQQHFQSFFCQFLGSPASADARAHHNCVKCLFGHDSWYLLIEMIYTSQI